MEIDKNPGLSETGDAARFACFSVASRTALVCFTVAVAEVIDAAGQSRPNCDQICAGETAACTGVALSEGLIAPPLTCDGPVPSSTTLCRCCAIGR